VPAVGEEWYRLGARLKGFVGEGVGVRKGGDDDVQRPAVVWRLVVRARQSLIPSTWNVVEHRGTFHRYNNNQPGYSGENLPPMMIS